MDSTLQELSYADLYQQAENVFSNSSPPSTSPEPKELRLVGPDDHDSIDQHRIYRDLLGVEPRVSSPFDESIVDEWLTEQLTSTSPEPKELGLVGLDGNDALSHSSNEFSQMNVYSDESSEQDQLYRDLLGADSRVSSPFDESIVDNEWLTKLLTTASAAQPEKPVVEQTTLKKIEVLQEVARLVAAKNEKTITEKKYPKPKLSYTFLSALAIKNSPKGQLPVTGIYEFLFRHFPYYKAAEPGWKNSLRHNLSQTDYFKRIETTTNGCVNERGSLWTIEDAKASELDEKLWKKILRFAEGICQAMPYPENFSALVCGNMKFVSSLNGKENGFMSEYLHMVEKQKNIEGEEEPSSVYPPAKRRKTDLTIDATAEE